MKKATIIITLSFFCQFSSAQEMSQYKGHNIIDKKVFNNILKRSDRHTNLNSLLGGQGYFYGGSLLDLIGFYDPGLNNGEISNGAPNAVSLLIHYLIFSQISTLMSNDCTISEEPNLEIHYQAKFLEVLQEICFTPKDQEVDDSVYLSFWIAIHGFETPKREYDEWKSFIKGQEYENHKDQVRDMSLTALMNPFFFLQN